MIDYLQSLEKFGMNLGLERITHLLEELGNPHLKFKSLHVTGTNGKGSTCAMIASILKEAGYTVGLYTSPHLFDWRERIKINGKDISEKDFEEGIKVVKKIARRVGQPTVFEVLTAVAFWYFAKKKVDYAVIEVGLGGRLDATNIITPLVSVITNIDLEHTAILGKSLAKIAAEKAAIIKPGIPVVTAEKKLEPLRVIKDYAQKKGSLLIKVESGLKTNLFGEHQRINAACAVAAIRLARIKVSRKAIAQGLKKVNWPGRFQIASRSPLTILDGAHNPAGIQSLVRTLRSKFPGQKFTFIFGVQKDKDAKTMLKLLKPLAKKIIITTSSHKNAAKIVEGIKAIAPQKALLLAKGENKVITGSLYLVGALSQKEW